MQKMFATLKATLFSMHNTYQYILFMVLFTNITPISLRLHFRVPYGNGMTAIPKIQYENHNKRAG